MLFIPTFVLAYFVSQPDTPFWLMLLVASTAGLGGGNFASSMANISFFYPDRMKGWALGLNAAGGNIGVSSVQLITPILMGVGLINLYHGFARLRRLSPERRVDVGHPADHRGVWRHLLHEQPDHGEVVVQGPSLRSSSASIPGSCPSSISAPSDPSSATRRPLPLLIKTQFPAITIAIAFLGPLVGSLSRPIGGLLADKFGGAILTFWNFIAMAAATIGVIYFVGAKDFTGFLVMFLILFVTTGVGNGSTYRMIPSIFREENLRKAEGKGEAGKALALKTASIESGAALGFIGAIGACGGYFIPSGFGKSIAITGGPQLALVIYLGFYAICLALTWWFYLRRVPAEAGVSSLAGARI